MIKTLSINLGGVVFQIDEDAYEALRKYLDSLNKYYKYEEGREDIVADIESRFAEIFSESLAKSGLKVVSMGDVEEVIGIMGRPEDFDEEGERYEGAADSGPSFSMNRRLFRDREEGILAGVCSGLAAYWGIRDPLWIRLAFIATALFSAFTVGVVVYIILWIVVPEARTKAQKLEMRGEPVNIANLEKIIREEIGGAGENLRDFAHNTRGGNGLRSLVNGIGKVFGAVAKLVFVLVKIFVAVLVIGIIGVLAISLLAALLSFLLAVPMSLKYIFAGTAGWLFAAVGGLLLLLIPLLFLVYLPFRIFGKHRMRNSALPAVAFGLFILGAVFSLVAFAHMADQFSEMESVTTQTVVPYPASDTLYLSLNHDPSGYERLEYDLKFSNLLAFTRQLETASDWVELDIIPSADDQVHLERTYRARGSSFDNARDNASAITYQARVEGDRILFDQFFGMGDDRKWRQQSVKLRLKVPEGLVIAPDHDMTNILDDVDNTRNASIYTVAGNRWRMNNGSLEPIDSMLTLGSTWSKKNMERINISDFSRIEIRGDVDVEVVKSDLHEVFMVAHGRLKNEMEVDREGSTLVIEREHFRWGRAGLAWLGNRDKVDPKFYVSLPELTSLQVSGQANVSVTGMDHREMSLEVSGQSHVDCVDIHIAVLAAELHGQSHVEMTGKADKFTLDISGQSNFDGESFEAGKLYLDMDGQSDAEMRVRDLVEGELNGMSDFEYWGDPEVNVSANNMSDMDKR